MKRIEVEGIRYGKKDFDEDYINWGFHDEETQIKEAESILKIINREPAKILDIGCGLGTHDVFWAKRGYDVTAIDISETFLKVAQEKANHEKVNINFLQQNILEISYHNKFDLITWIENSFFDNNAVKKIYDALKFNGIYIYDVRNPEHPKMKRFRENFNDWREENGVYYLDKHHIDSVTGTNLEQWIKIDTNNNFVEIKNYEHKPVPLSDQLSILKQCGFQEVKLIDIEGNLFNGNDSTYWLWVVCYK